jgi:hypothetical protein
MVANGLGHIGFSLVQTDVVPGTISSPVLIVAALWQIDRFVFHWDTD